jgi:hypothetical protein
MAAQLLNVAIGLLTTLLGYFVGRAWQKLVDQVPYRRTRRLWGPLLDGGLQIVVSRFLIPPFRDPGVVGGGDALALRVITSYFASAGIKGVETVYVDEPSLDRRKNIITLGGPSTNSVTKDALERMAAHVQIVDPGPNKPVEVHDLAAVSPGSASLPSPASGRRHRTRVQRYAARPETDHGIIVRAGNPFNPDKEILIIAGAWGYGSWGGAELASNENFLERCNRLGAKGSAPRSKGWRSLPRALFSKDAVWRGTPRNPRSQVPFECIFSVDVFDKRPLAAKIIALRQIDYAAK